MRKVLSIICALILTALMPAAWLVSRGLPADTGRYAAQKYAGWSGVLQAWVYCDWQPGGSFISWLNRCAGQFEKERDGVYIEFIPVTREAMAGLGSNGIRAPELVFFSPGAVRSSALQYIGGSVLLREELANLSPALPVAMGGAIWVVNRALAETCSFEEAIIPAGFETAAAGLLSGDARQEAPAVIDPGLDLGLPVSANSGDHSMAALLNRFISGELPCLPVTQAEIARLARLQGAGRGPDWECVPSGEYAWGGQLLMAGVTAGDSERHALAGEFLRMLLDEDSQAALVQAGAFSVTGQAVHAAHSPYAQLDALLNSRPLRVPSVFSEHSLR